MKDVANGHRWLFERREKDGTRRYYLRARVPLDIVQVMGKREIKRSLRTADRKEALERIDVPAAEVNAAFAEARRSLEDAKACDFTTEEARRMVFLWFRNADRQAAEADFGITEDWLPEALENAGIEEMIFARAVEEEASPHVQRVADAILAAHGFPTKPAGVPGGPIKPLLRGSVADVDKTSDAYLELCEQVRRGLLETARRTQDRLRGQEARTADPAFSRDTVEAVAAGPPLSKILLMWVEERRPPQKTEREWRTAQRRFTEIHGDLPVDAVTKAHVREFKDALVKVPSSLPRALRAKPLPAIGAATKGDGRARLSPAAVGKQLAAVSSLLSWSVSNGYVSANAATGVGVARSKAPGDGRQPYDADDLRVLFADAGRFRDSQPSRFWLPLLAAFTGARLGELGQLRVGDVRHRDGVDFIDISAGDGKSVKTRSSVREVPLHPELVRCGVLKYVEVRRQADGTDAPLFPDLRADSLGNLVGRFSKWWRRHRRGLGVADPRKPFHAFRHGFKQACREAGVGEEVHDALTGHAGGGVGRTYGGVPLIVKAGAVVRVGYGVDLSHLHADGAGDS